VAGPEAGLTLGCRSILIEQYREKRPVGYAFNHDTLMEAAQLIIDGSGVEDRSRQGRLFMTNFEQLKVKIFADGVDAKTLKAGLGDPFFRLDVERTRVVNR
jgi:hypothetical protein